MSSANLLGVLPYTGEIRISGSVITSWVLMLFLAVVSWLSARMLRENPGNYQIVLEGIVSTMEDAIESVLPGKCGLVFPFIATLWIFILLANLAGIVPGLHSPTSDLSVTSSLAVLVFLSVHWFGIRAEGLKAYLKHYVTPSPILLPFHLISEVSRTLALAVRLFGNVMSLEIGYALILSGRRFLSSSSVANASCGRGGHSSISVRHACFDLHRRRHSSPRTPARKGKRCNLKDINSFVTISTIVAALGIVLGTMLPALAMGRAISKALEALAHQPEAESSITRALFVGLAMIESLSIYCLVIVLIILFRNPLIQYLVKP